MVRPGEDTGWGSHEFAMSRLRMRLSLERTRMAADRTLRSHARTGLSLTTFGFTVFTALTHAREANLVEADLDGVRLVALALTGLGLATAIAGVVARLRTRRALDARWDGLIEGGLIPAETRPGVGAVMWSAGAVILLALAATLWILARTTR